MTKKVKTMESNPCNSCEKEIIHHSFSLARDEVRGSGKVFHFLCTHYAALYVLGKASTFNQLLVLFSYIWQMSLLYIDCDCYVNCFRLLRLASSFHLLTHVQGCEYSNGTKFINQGLFLLTRAFSQPCHYEDIAQKI